jgi:hypothetical protein
MYEIGYFHPIVLIVCKIIVIFVFVITKYILNFLYLVNYETVIEKLSNLVLNDESSSTDFFTKYLLNPFRLDKDYVYAGVNDKPSTNNCAFVCIAFIMGLTVSQLLNKYGIQQTNCMTIEQVLAIFNDKIGYKTTCKIFEYKNFLISYLAVALWRSANDKIYILGYTNDLMNGCNSHMVLLRTRMNQKNCLEHQIIDYSKPNHEQTSLNLPIGRKYYLILTEGINN